MAEPLENEGTGKEDGVTASLSQAGSQIRVPVADYLGKFLEARNG